LVTGSAQPSDLSQTDYQSMSAEEQAKVLAQWEQWNAWSAYQQYQDPNTQYYAQQQQQQQQQVMSEESRVAYFRKACMHVHLDPLHSPDHMIRLMTCCWDLISTIHLYRITTIISNCSMRNNSNTTSNRCAATVDTCFFASARSLSDDLKKRTYCSSAITQYGQQMDYSGSFGAAAGYGQPAAIGMMGMQQQQQQQQQQGYGMAQAYAAGKLHSVNSARNSLAYPQPLPHSFTVSLVPLQEGKRASTPFKATTLSQCKEGCTPLRLWHRPLISHPCPPRGCPSG
jgi:hypothetical protein